MGKEVRQSNKAGYCCGLDYPATGIEVLLLVCLGFSS